MAAYNRHDISDEFWAKLSPLLSGNQGGWGGIAKDNRLFINAVLWILRTGAPWRDLPPTYGDWKNTHRRFFGGFVVGGIKAGGNSYWKAWCKSLTWNG